MTGKPGLYKVEAVIEKPNVAIIPKRVKPDLNEVLFIDRSFERELKEMPRDLLLLDDELDKPKKVEGLNRVIKGTKEDPSAGKK